MSTTCKCNLYFIIITTAQSSLNLLLLHRTLELRPDYLWREYGIVCRGGCCIRFETWNAVNDFCSMKRSAMQRGVLKFEPQLLPAYDLLYGPNATGSCYFYAAEGSKSLGSCQMTVGVAQGDRLGPLLFRGAWTGDSSWVRLLFRCYRRPRTYPCSGTNIY